MMGQSTSIIEWHIPKTTESGKYRIQYFGHSKELFSSIRAFNGTSSTFEVSNWWFPIEKHEVATFILKKKG